MPCRVGSEDGGSPVPPGERRGTDIDRIDEDLPSGHGPRRRLKRLLAKAPSAGARDGLTILIYHRIAGGTPDERDLALDDFQAQLEVLADHRVVGLDQAIDELEAGDDRQKVVLTFDDGFADVASAALPLLADKGLPFTLYLTTAYVGGEMRWDGSTAKVPAGPALDWTQLRALVDSGLCTIGNHTHTHARPELLTDTELDRCTETIERELGITPAHFAYTWGIPVPGMLPALRARFRSAATGQLGRNHPAGGQLALRRIPVRQSDPVEFFAAKLEGRLLPERLYGGIVAGAKRLGLSA